MSLVEIAHDFAQMERYDGLEAVQTYHGGSVLPHRLDVLSSIPDPADPAAYQKLLPKCSTVDGKAVVVQWEEKRWREQDWSEGPQWNAQVASAVKEISSGPCAKRKKQMGESLHLSTGLTVPEVTRWYLERTRQIDRLSGQLDVALKLVTIGIQNNVPALEELKVQASSMCVLVYGLGCVASDVTLEAYEALSNPQRMALLLADCEEDTDVVSRLKGDGLKFVMQLFAGNDKPDDKAFCLLRHQMVQWAKGGSLGRVVAILKARTDLFCDPASPKQGLLAVDGALVVESALECMVACSAATENSIQEKLSDWLMTEIKKLPSTADATIKKVQTLDGQLRAARILDRRGLVRPVAFFGSCTEQEAKRLVEEMVSSGVRARPAWDRAQWRALLQDLADLQRGVLHMVPLAWCLHQYLEGLLGCARGDVIELAREVLLDPSLAPDQNALAIPMADAEPMVLKAAREYFNSARSYTDPSMGLAQTCLRMLPPSPAVSSEHTLIKAAEVLSSLGVSEVLPVQLRLAGDKAEIVRSAIRAQPDNYCKVTALKSLGLALGLCGDGPMDGGYADILAMAADRAMQVNEYDVASEICDTLMDAPGQHGWSVCHQLGRIDRPDTSSCRRLLTYALQTCPASAIANIMPDLSSLERRELGSGVGETQWVGQVGSALARLRKSPLLLGERPTATPTQPSPSPAIHHDFYSRPRHQPPPTSAAARQTVQPKPFPYKDHPTRISQQAAVLRLHTLADQGGDKGPENVRSCCPLLVDLCVAAAATDCRLFVAYLLAMWNGEDSRQVFRRCAPSEDTLSLAAYFYALQAYCAMQRSKGHNPPLSIYRHSPKELINQIQDAEGQGEASELLQSVRGWLKQLADCRMEQRIKGHAAAVDMARFGADETYRQNIITQLVSQPSSEAFSTALALGQQYHVEGWVLAYRHTKAMFALNPPTLEENIAAVQDLLLQRPSDLFTHLSTEVYPTLPGTQLAPLSLYLRLLTAAREADASIPEPNSVPVHDQLKIVTQLSGCNLPGVDYKALITAKDPLAILEPHLSDSTVSALASCLPLIPTPTGHMTSSSVYKALIEKVFNAPNVSGGDGTEWQATYNACRPYFDHLSPQDALPLYLNIAGPSAISVPAAIRLSISRDGLKWAQSLNPQDEVLVSGLQSLVRHLQWVAEGPLIGQLAEMGSAYVRDYDAVTGDAGALDALGVRLAVNGASLSLLQSFHTHRISDLHQSTTLPDTLLAAADCATASIFSCDRTTTLGGPENPVAAGGGVAALRHVLADVAGLDQWDGSVKTNDITGLVLGRASNTNSSGDMRLAVLSLLQQHNLHQVEGGAMQHIRAQAIINDTWGMKVDESAMATPPQQEALFKQLLSLSAAKEGPLLQLAELLVLWDGPAESAEGMWTQLLAAMGQCSGLVQPALSFLLPGGHAADCRSYQMDEAVVGAFVSAGYMGAALQVAASSKQEGALVEAVVTAMKAHTGPVAPIEPTLLHPLLARPTLLAPLVRTPYWPDIVNVLVIAAPQGSGPTFESEQAMYRCGYAAVVAGLVLGGSMGNAVSLSLRYYGIRPSLFSWDSGLVTLRRLFDTTVEPIPDPIPTNLSWVPNTDTVTELCTRAKATVFPSE